MIEKKKNLERVHHEASTQNNTGSCYFSSATFPTRCIQSISKVLPESLSCSFKSLFPNIVRKDAIRRLLASFSHFYKKRRSLVVKFGEAKRSRCIAPFFSFLGSCRIRSSIKQQICGGVRWCKGTKLRINAILLKLQVLFI